MTQVRIGIDARIGHAVAGGLEQFVIGLATGFSSLSDGDEKYIFFGDEDAKRWLEPHLSGNASLNVCSKKAQHVRRGDFRKALGQMAVVKWVMYNAPVLSGVGLGRLPSIDDLAREARLSLVHFTTQAGGVTMLPCVYNPHDLQHLHLPQFFTARERKSREALYRSMCDRASLVAASSSWVKDDLIRHYGLPNEKVAVVPLAPAVEGYPVPTESELIAVGQKFALPALFAFYPAQTWPHKNHLRLLDALARLRRQGLCVNLVCSGTTNHHYEKIARHVVELGLSEQVRFVGFVSTLELQCLYRLSRLVVVPTLFEAASFPLWEAFYAGTPVCCSSVTSLPKQAGSAAVVFDPLSVGSIAEAIAQVWTDEHRRVRLVEAGSRNVSKFTWKQTTLLFRAHYRRILGFRLSPEDEARLAAPPIL